MAADFGRTWWGRQWLAAFDGIDQSNRLPRGRRYANNGSVRAVNIAGGTAARRPRGCWARGPHRTGSVSRCRHAPRPSDRRSWRRCKPIQCCCRACSTASCPLKTDRSIIADLPDKIEANRYCRLSAEQASLYQNSVETIMQELAAAEEGVERRGIIFKLLNALKQICNGPAQFAGRETADIEASGKLAAFMGILREIDAAGEKPSSSPSTRRWAGCWRPPSATDSASTPRFCTAGLPASSAMAWSMHSRARAARAP